MLSDFIKKHCLPEEFKQTAEEYYQPLAKEIFEQFSRTGQVFCVGINGCQGSGKSTLTDFVASYLSKQYQLNVVAMSLDDFYFSSKKRNHLARCIHPLLATRGVPGTHDVDMLEGILAQLKKRKTGFSIPKFNKATDEPFSKSQWNKVVKPIDIILVEGWFWGVKPQTASTLKEPLNALERQHDKNSVWRSYVNQQLEEKHLPLYKYMDFWVALHAPSFDCVYKWRLEQEKKLAIKNIGLANSKIQSAEEILNFIQYFQRLTIQSGNTICNTANITFYLDAERHISEKIQR